MNRDRHDHAFLSLQPVRTIRLKRHGLSLGHPLALSGDVFDHADGCPVTFEDDELGRWAQTLPQRPIHSIDPHDHEHYEITFVLAGSALHCTRQFEKRVERGTCIVVAPRRVHGYREIDGFVRATCLYMEEWFVHEAKELWAEPGVLELFFAGGAFSGDVTPMIAHNVLKDEELETCGQELKAMHDELQRPAPSQQFLKRCLGKLMITVGRSYAQASHASDGSVLAEWVVEAVKVVERAASSGEEFSVADLAGHCAVSPSHLTNAFKKSFNMSPKGYYQQRRVQHGAWLLANSQQSVTEIAQSLGFTDSPHFVKAFRQFRGMCPTEYRKRFGLNAEPDDADGAESSDT